MNSVPDEWHNSKGNRRGHNFRGPAKVIRREEASWNWKGDNVCKDTGRMRARRMYIVSGKCQTCDAPAKDRHHVDGNTLNNAPENIQFLCRRCHMTVDGRLAALPHHNIPIQPDKPCIICQKLSKPLRRGRCHSCDEWRRRNGKDRNE